MSKLTQKNRPLAIDTPLGEDVLILTRMSASEELGRPFRYELDLVSEQPEGVDFDKIISENVTIHLQTENGDQRHFNGFVSRLTHTLIDGSLTHYKAVVVPWLWFLTRTADCRIFQDMTVPDIIQQVFRDHGYSDFEDGLSGEYREWDYCVQYRESAFDFVSRLMEQEGIYYFFNHEDDKHVLVLADSPAAHEAIAGTAKLPYHPPKEQIDKPHISGWTLDREVLPGTYAVSDFDFTRPKQELHKKSDADHGYTVTDGEVFDYPGEYTDYSHAQSYSKIRVEELHAGVEVTKCGTDARTINVGSTYELTDYPIDKHNKKYLITSATHELISDITQELGEASNAPLCRCRFSAIDAQRQFRSARTTPLPHIRGPQTAIVVGPDDSEIHTDEYGRIKVQFHWDRQGNFDANSSCWVRVSQNWAGDKWGGMFIPHKGQEVIVEFLEGDPDRPIITGRVYNKDNMPPDFKDDDDQRTGLPDNKHKSIIRDDYGNEMIFDATPDDEHIRIHSPHHESTLLLGKSVKCATESNSFTFTHGNKNEIIVGVQTGLGVGINAEAFIGYGFGFNLSSKTEINLGIEKSFNWGPKLSYSKNDEVEISTGDFKQQVEEEIVLDSEKAAYMVGGPDNNAQIQLLGPEGPIGARTKTGSIVLSYSEDGKERDSKVGDIALLATLAGGGAVGGVAAAATTALAWDLNDDGWQIGMGITSGVLLAGLIAADVALGEKIKNYQTGPPEVDETPDSKITLNELFLELEAGESFIQIKKDGSIIIDTTKATKGHKQILLDSTGDIILDSAEGNIDVKGKIIDIKGKVNHKNITILE